MYMEASGHRQNDKARLISPIYQGSNQQMCLKFWYNMYGGAVDTLNVYRMVQGVTGKPVWTLKGEKGETGG